MHAEGRTRPAMWKRRRMKQAKQNVKMRKGMNKNTEGMDEWMDGGNKGRECDERR